MEIRALRALLLQVWNIHTHASGSPDRFSINLRLPASNLTRGVASSRGTSHCKDYGAWGTWGVYVRVRLFTKPTTG